MRIDGFCEFSSCTVDGKLIAKAVFVESSDKVYTAEITTEEELKNYDPTEYIVVKDLSTETIRKTLEDLPFEEIESKLTLQNTAEY